MNNDGVRLLYFNAERNVGDEFGVDVVRKLSGKPVLRVVDLSKPHIVALGSILTFATDQSRVWGTGLIEDRYCGGARDGRQFYSVRGKRTYSKLLADGVNLPDLPLGDPGYLASCLFGHQKDSTPNFKLGVVPHYVDKNMDCFKRFCGHPEVLFIDVQKGVDHFFDCIKRCSCIASTSLHGLIFAESLGIPNVWIKASENITGGDFKFMDWFSVCGAPQKSPLIINDSTTVAELTSNSELHGCEIDCDDLIKAFPVYD